MPQPNLDERTLPDQPFPLFAEWLEAAIAANLHEPSAMALATCTLSGVPSVRIVLLRGFDERGFVFYTNYGSRKGDELAENPRASLAMHWGPLERQIRIEGSVVKVSGDESNVYFQSRPRGHQLGAVVSPQSQVIPNRDFLEKRLASLTAKVGDDMVDRPDHWGGYRVQPVVVEFWQGQPNRLHDRIRYRKITGSWARERLAP